jgi:hypothetical protein
MLHNSSLMIRLGSDKPQFNREKDKKLDLTTLVKFIKDNLELIQNPENDLSQSIDGDATESDGEEKTYTMNPLEILASECLKKLPSNLTEIFRSHLENMTRFGVVRNMDNKTKNNISFYTSLFSCIEKDFLMQPEKNQLTYIKTLVGRLSLLVKGELFTKMNYKMFGWVSGKVSDDVAKYDVNNFTLRLISDYFHVNLFVIDIEDDSLKASIGNNFIPYKKNIFMIRIEGNNFEPVFYNDKKFLEHDSTLIKDLLKNSDRLEIYDVNLKLSSDTQVFEVKEEELDKYIIVQKDYHVAGPKLDFKILKNQRMKEQREKENKEIKEDEESAEIKDSKETAEHVNNFTEMTVNDDDSDIVSDLESDSNNSILLDDTKVKKLIVKDKNKKVTKKKVNSDSDDEAEDEVDEEEDTLSEYGIDLKNVSSAMKLTELQSIAKKLKISISSKEKGKTKLKTKQQLADEIKMKK